MNHLVGWMLAVFSAFAFVVALAGIWGALDSMVAWQMLFSAIAAAVFVSGINQIILTHFKPKG